MGSIQNAPARLSVQRTRSRPPVSHWLRTDMPTNATLPPPDCTSEVSCLQMCRFQSFRQRWTQTSRDMRGVFVVGLELMWNFPLWLQLKSEVGWEDVKWGRKASAPVCEHTLPQKATTTSRVTLSSELRLHSPLCLHQTGPEPSLSCPSPYPQWRESSAHEHS